MHLDIRFYLKCFDVLNILQEKYIAKSVYNLYIILCFIRFILELIFKFV